MRRRGLVSLERGSEGRTARGIGDSERRGREMVRRTGEIGGERLRLIRREGGSYGEGLLVRGIFHHLFMMFFGKEGGIGDGGAGWVCLEGGS